MVAADGVAGDEDDDSRFQKDPTPTPDVVLMTAIVTQGHNDNS